MNPIFKSCKDCAHVETCPKYDNCEYLSKANQDTYAEELMSLLRRNKKQTNQKEYPSLHGSTSPRNKNDFSTYEYYRQMINGCLKEIRAGRIAYVYKEEHVRDIFRFEPDIKLSYKDKVFYVSL